MRPLAELREECRTAALGGNPGPLRRCAFGGFLFVSDLPKHASPEVLGRVVQSLEQAGFVCKHDRDQELLFLDASLPRYERLLRGLPIALPPLPRNDRLHPAYALCSLLLLHPAPLADQPLEPLRRVLKLTEAAASPLLQAIPALHEECALLMRERKPLPHAAGQVLAAWLVG